MSMADTKPTDTPAIVVPAHRTKFKQLMLSNPNYFGTLPKFGGEPVLKQSGDTFFEQLTCLGLNPAQNRLEAVFQIKQHNGYSGGACGDGSVEYVRFFVQHPDGWHDVGLATVTVFDLATSPLPLSYSVSVELKEPHRFCSTENILNVRAILSWNDEPTPGDSNYNPVWGNRVDARVQVAPLVLTKIPLGDLVQLELVKFDPTVLQALDLTTTLSTKAVAPLSAEQLKAAYGDKVPGHRFAFKEAKLALAKPLPDFTKTAIKTSINIGDILVAIADQSGDTRFEEMMCAGYNPTTRELEAVIQIKENAGYSGGLCTPGSTEYVSFYGFWGGVWHTLGTSTVQVHDLAAVSPGRPLMYAVRRISGLTEMPCESLTGVPLRAILSWNEEPTGPGYSPTWGNVINTHVQPQIGSVPPGNHIRFMAIGGVHTPGISNVSGLANPTGITGDCVGNDSPFGGELLIIGDFTPKLDVFDSFSGNVIGGTHPLIYQAWVTRTDVPSTPFQLTNPYTVRLYPATGPDHNFLSQVKPAPGTVIGGIAGTEYFQYMEGSVQVVDPRTLAVFEAGGMPEGKYLVEIRGWAYNGVNYVPMVTQSQLIRVFNGYPHTELGTTVLRPQVALTMTSIVDCGDAVVGDVVKGTFSVTDHYFGSASIGLVPVTISGNPVVENPVEVFADAAMTIPLTMSYNGFNTGGISGYFRLSTAGMVACGYTIELYSEDRALVDSHCYHHWNQIGVGFCLRAPILTAKK
jgi:hypothetical protein